MLLSVANMKLRDFYKNLDEMCEELEIGKEELTAALEKIDYHYDEAQNQFV